MISRLHKHWIQIQVTMYDFNLLHSYSRLISIGIKVWWTNLVKELLAGCVWLDGKFQLRVHSGDADIYLKMTSLHSIRSVIHGYVQCNFCTTSVCQSVAPIVSDIEPAYNICSDSRKQWHTAIVWSFWDVLSNSYPIQTINYHAIKNQWASAKTLAFSLEKFICLNVVVRI